jgi:hypothetical protein
VGQDDQTFEYKELGPWDQGQFSSSTFRLILHSRVDLFNWKVIKVPNEDAVILHFHGPQARHLLAAAIDDRARVERT